MNIELFKDDLIILVKGSSPSYHFMEKEPFKSCGVYNGSYGTWDWMTHKLKELTEEELWKMHVTMKFQYKE